jgi:hypothetical protein
MPCYNVADGRHSSYVGSDFQSGITMESSSVGVSSSSSRRRVAAIQNVKRRAGKDREYPELDPTSLATDYNNSRKGELSKKTEAARS